MSHERKLFRSRERAEERPRGDGWNTIQVEVTSCGDSLAGGTRTRRRIGRRSRLALTMAELVLVLAMTTVIAGTALPRVSLLLASIRLPLGARQLAADLALARATAVLRNTSVRVTFSADAYTVRYDLGAPREVFGRLPAGVHVESLPVSQTIRFYPTGRADNGTVVLAGSSGARRSVVVNQRGRVVVR